MSNSYSRGGEPRSSTSAVRKRSNKPPSVKKQYEADRAQSIKVRERPTWEQCRVSDCLKKPSSAHGLCHDHGKQIADAFQRFYMAAQNVVEDLAICAIKSLPEAQIDNPFIRHCDRFLEEAIPHWLEDQEAFRNIEIRRPKRSAEERRRRKR